MQNEALPLYDDEVKLPALRLSEEAMEFCNEEQLAQIAKERIKQKERELERIAKSRLQLEQLGTKIILEAASDCEKSSLASYNMK